MTAKYHRIYVVWLCCTLGAVTVLRCVEARSPSLTLSCPGPTDQYMISIRSAYYARLPFNTPGFCEQPTPNSNRGVCVPHANVDRDVAASSCNTYNSCVLYPSYNDIVSSCSSVTGQVYAHVEFDCLSRESALNFHLMMNDDDDDKIACFNVR